MTTYKQVALRAMHDERAARKRQRELDAARRVAYHPAQPDRWLRKWRVDGESFTVYRQGGRYFLFVLRDGENDQCPLTLDEARAWRPAEGWSETEMDENRLPGDPFWPASA